MDEVLKKTLLYDFYGELLTEHQRRIFEEVVLNDYSASEVAKDEGISRQGIHDLIRRTGLQLENYENKLHLVDKFITIRSKAAAIQKLARSAEQENFTRIESIASEIIEDL